MSVRIVPRPRKLRKLPGVPKPRPFALTALLGEAVYVNAGNFCRASGILVGVVACRSTLDTDVTGVGVLLPLRIRDPVTTTSFSVSSACGVCEVSRGPLEEGFELESWL